MRDAQGHELSGATTEAVGYFDSAVRAFTLIYGDASGLYDAALNASPKLVMAYLGKAWPLVPQELHPALEFYLRRVQRRTAPPQDRRRHR